MSLHLRAFLASLPDFGLAGMYLVTWIAPFTFGERMVSHLMLVMLMEFIILHSSVFAGVIAFSETPRRRKTLTLIGISLFYTAFVAGFALAFGVWWPVAAFWGLMLNRMLGVLLGQVPTGKEKVLIGKSWVVGILAYLLFVGVTTLLPVPSLGIDSHVIGAQEFEASGLWIDEPQRVIVFGFLYFTVTALSELRSHAWLPAPSIPFDKLRLFNKKS